MNRSIDIAPGTAVAIVVRWVRVQGRVVVLRATKERAVDLVAQVASALDAIDADLVNRAKERGEVVNFEPVYGFDAVADAIAHIEEREHNRQG